METPAPIDPHEGLDALADPARRALYEYVAAQSQPVTRAQAAQHSGMKRGLAAYHLDRLVAAGLLAFSYARDEGKSGPGAGRPAKRYTRASDDFAISLPPRKYHTLAGILADAVAADSSGAVSAALSAAARAEGARAAAEAADARTPASVPVPATASVPEAGTMAALRAHGYEPTVTDDGTIIMRNCPFHQVAQQQPKLVCTLNHDLLQGYLQGAGDDPERAELSPCSGRCCVVIHPAAADRR
ncbi:helix-turn-helix transcriptional regulator [Microbacterium sp. YY-01]|uniref:helix-turn-helix transcriptional regulator n=1 Tax=Microbacterium sp. YY-01 TaxID=3421634 RepID=UPI003D17AE0B